MKRGRINNISSNNKHCCIWLTGLSGSGKTTISTTLKKIFDQQCITSVCLDGDTLRTGVNKNLGFSNEDRNENVRRISEVSKIFAMNGIIPITSCISPYKEARNSARKVHHDSGIEFLEVYVNSSLEVCEKRDIKGLYKKAREGLIKKFTGIDDLYEEPETPDLILRTDLNSIDYCIEELINFLISKEILKIDNFNDFSLENPQSIKELCIHDNEKENKYKLSESFPKWHINKIDLQWIQVLSEGWASPLTGFMREIDYLQCLHFSGITRAGKFINMSLPIVLAVDEKLKSAEPTNLALYYDNELIAIMSNLEFYPHRKEERVARMFGSTDVNHPTIDLIMQSGDWLVGGDIDVLKNGITWNDGLDKYRLTPKEIRQRIDQVQADAVFAFQLRNPIHNGHALLMQETRRRLVEEMGHKRPLLLLHPLGGWVKDDDVPLKERILQHEACIEEGVLDASSTLLAIFPSPMVYAGPREVQWHARTRRLCGANYYIVGRDPAGIKNPSSPDDDLYEPSHGRKLLCNAPGLDNLHILPFTVAAFNVKTRKMEFYDEKRKEEFLFISGSKMRKIARDGEQPPDGFMAPKAWSIVAKYYSHKQC